jgi:hypothetical protein
MMACFGKKATATVFPTYSEFVEAVSRDTGDAVSEASDNTANAVIAER